MPVMGRTMLVINPDGGGELLLDEVEAENEKQLAGLLKTWPELLPWKELGLELPVVVGKDTALPSGMVDLVVLGKGGDLALIEFKTGATAPDTRAYMAQVIDHASDLWDMTVDEFEEYVALRYFNSPSCPPVAPAYKAKSLADVLKATWGTDPKDDVKGWQDRLDNQLRTGAFRFISVSQRFTDAELRSMRYLNATVPNSQFYAVELIRFRAAPSSGVNAFEARLRQAPEDFTLPTES
jgi:hypothetical protein